MTAPTPNKGMTCLMCGQQMRSTVRCPKYGGGICMSHCYDGSCCFLDERISATRCTYLDVRSRIVDGNG